MMKHPMTGETVAEKVEELLRSGPEQADWWADHQYLFAKYQSGKAFDKDDATGLLRWEQRVEFWKEVKAALARRATP